ncbi:hypothetical protein V6R21_11250 [Limibacter armeniacum]|uniref:heavy-metal-associated domain-containing protein n=1 Tax=Limibacter armeniacum TaxID=466084 RepID=UPI002FE68F25
MKTLKFKTNINCGNCIKSVTPTLNEEFAIINWSVDTDNPDKVLTVEGEEGELTAELVMDAIKKAGFKIEKA